MKIQEKPVLTVTNTEVWGQRPKSVLLINGESIRFNFLEGKPNAWFRFWQRIFLGWEWRDYYRSISA